MNNVRASHLITVASQDLNEMSCLSVSTDGRNCGLLKLFPVLIQCFHKVYGIKSQLTGENSTPSE
jgi:hypothetical protein